MVIVGPVLSLTAAIPDMVHPSASVTETVYAPAARPVSVAAKPPDDHAYVNGLTPPLSTAALALPSDRPQFVLTMDVEMAISSASVIEMLVSDEHPKASVMVTA